MESLYSYLIESSFKGVDFVKHNYAKDVIDKILTGTPLRLGKDGNSGVFTLDKEAIEDVRSRLENVRSVKEFDDILNPYHLRWSNIFKGDFSGYVGGLTSKNRGNQFEVDYINNFEEHKQDLAKVLHISPDKFDGCTPVLRGGENQRRPLVQGREGLVVGGAHSNVGESVVDVYVEDVDGNPYYLSLKYGSTVTFCNVGIKRLFTDKSFNEYKNTGEYIADSYNGVNGQELLDLFNIDANKFADIFVNGGTTKDYTDITKELQSNKAFKEFLKSVVGYGYVLVHQIGKDIHYIDLRKESDMNKLIGDVKNARIQYGGVTGKGKRIDIIVEMTNMDIKFNIRNKQGGVFPTHIMADYVIK